MKRVFAKWLVSDLPDNFTDFYISCGAGDDQWDGYFIHDKGATLNIKYNKHRFYEVEFTAPALNLTKYKDAWLSPALICDTWEATKWGIRK